MSDLCPKWVEDLSEKHFKLIAPYIRMGGKCYADTPNAVYVMDRCFYLNKKENEVIALE